jgi:hypothetical protein
LSHIGQPRPGARTPKKKPEKACQTHQGLHDVPVSQQRKGTSHGAKTAILSGPGTARDRPRAASPFSPRQSATDPPIGHFNRRPWTGAGPNGAGKTTFATEFLPFYARCHNFINPDLLARAFSPFDPDAGMFRAGRSVLERIAEFTLYEQLRREFAP